MRCRPQFRQREVLQWRNSKLDFSSLGSLQVSLAQTPAHDALTVPRSRRFAGARSRRARRDVREMAHGAAAVERLWDACQSGLSQDRAGPRMPNW